MVVIVCTSKNRLSFYKLEQVVYRCYINPNSSFSLGQFYATLTFHAVNNIRKTSDRKKCYLGCHHRLEDVKVRIVSDLYIIWHSRTAMSIHHILRISSSLTEGRCKDETLVLLL